MTSASLAIRKLTRVLGMTTCRPGPGGSVLSCLCFFLCHCVRVPVSFVINWDPVRDAVCLSPCCVSPLQSGFLSIFVLSLSRIISKLSTTNSNDKGKNVNVTCIEVAVALNYTECANDLAGDDAGRH